MTKVEDTLVAPARVAKDLKVSDLIDAVGAGWRDFKAFPTFGLFFSAIFVSGGFFLYFVFFVWNEVAWFIPIAAGFPLLAPFVAVGLYEVSRRREAGEPMRWRAILSTVWARGDEQIISIGVILFVAFGFWLMIAHGIFAIFLAESDAGAESIELFRETAGLMMLLVGSIVGALIALAFYSITVVSLPMLVDRKVDFITAIIVSLATVRSNKFVMLAWAVIAAISLFAAMLPFLLGLFIVLPVLGHATWHLFRRAVSDADAGQQ